MKVLAGDLLSMAEAGEFDVIVHGCNCQCKMGKGIALSIKKDFPEAYDADCQTTPGDTSKLGSYTAADIVRGDTSFTVVNAYTQMHWRGLGRKVDYEALEQVFRKIKTDFAGKRIGYPKIGAGLGGGDWEVAADIIDRALEGEDHSLVELNT